MLVCSAWLVRDVLPEGGHVGDEERLLLHVAPQGSSRGLPPETRRAWRIDRRASARFGKKPGPGRGSGRRPQGPSRPSPFWSEAPRCEFRVPCSSSRPWGGLTAVRTSRLVRSAP